MKMTGWIKLKIEKRYVGKRTATGVLVYFPNETEFSDWCVTVPSRTIRESKDCFTLTTKPDFKYVIQLILRDERGNWKTKEMKEINGTELIRLFRTTQSLSK